MVDASVVLTAPATHALANDDLTPNSGTNNVNFMIIIYN
jgi:hypothetical protein